MQKIAKSLNNIVYCYKLLQIVVGCATLLRRRSSRENAALAWVRRSLVKHVNVNYKDICTTRALAYIKCIFTCIAILECG
jgi:hypothetical protein